MSKFYDSSDENNLHGELSAMLTLHALRDKPEMLKQIFDQSGNVDTGAVHKAVRAHVHENLRRIGVIPCGPSSKQSGNADTRAKQRTSWDDRELTRRAKGVMADEAAKSNSEKFVGGMAGGGLAAAGKNVLHPGGLWELLSPSETADAVPLSTGPQADAYAAVRSAQRAALRTQAARAGVPGSTSSGTRLESCGHQGSIPP